MPVPADLVGATTSPIAHAVDARWTMAFAAALGCTDAALLDTARPGGVVAHPLFPVCVEWPAMVAARLLADPAVLPRSEYVRGVHATHDTVLHRVVRPGDELSTVASVEAVEARRSGASQVLRLTTVDAAGEAVATTRAGSVFRGVAVAGEPVPLGPDATFPAVPAPPSRPGARRLGRVVDLPANLAHTYTEGSRIWNPIHTDMAVARQAGLARPILHGTATLAVAVTEILAAFGDGDPAAVRRVGCRFTGMVELPAPITVVVAAESRLAAHPDARLLHFSVLAPGPRPVIEDGFVELGPRR